MFFFFSKVVPAFLFPYPLFMVLALLAAWKMKRGWFRRAFVAVWIALAAMSSYAVAAPLVRSLEQRYLPMKIADAPQADAIVVLAGMVTPLVPSAGEPEFSDAVDRILAGRNLYRAGKAPVIIVTGGSGLLSQAGEPEAVTLHRWLLGEGIPQQAIIEESASRNTAENAIETAKIASTRGIRRVILVTSAFHMLRSEMCFQKAGLEVIPFAVDYKIPEQFPGLEAAIPHPAGVVLSGIALKEYAGIVAYRWRGYL
jgi:uncharacterized SAM-binding protein YcdF (DUF218 family)